MRDWLRAGLDRGADARLDDAPGVDTRWHGAAVRHDPVQAVYFALAVGGNMIKIGMVADVDYVQRRMELLQPGCPYDLKVLLVVPSFGRREEARLHRIYAEYQFRSEWFRCDGRLKTLLQIAAADGQVAARDHLVMILFDNRTLPP